MKKSEEDWVDSAQLQVIDYEYNVYVNTRTQGHRFVNCLQQALQTNKVISPIILGLFVGYLILSTDNLLELELQITKDYSLVHQLSIVVDMIHGFVILDGGINPVDGKRYDKYRISIDEFIGSFSDKAHLS